MKTQLEGIKMMENPEQCETWHHFCNESRNGELEEKNIARCCLIHNIISETLCKISVCIHKSPSPWGLHCSGSSSVHPCALYPLAVNLCGCSRYICIPLFSPWTSLFHLIRWVYVWPLTLFPTQGSWRRRWRIQRWRTSPRNRNTSSDTESSSCPANWSLYLPHTSGTPPWIYTTKWSVLVSVFLFPLEFWAHTVFW